VIAEVSFWGSLACLGCVYFGHPLVTWVLASLRPRPVRRGPTTPSVTVVIAAYNEAQHIVATIRNKLDSDYPEALLDVLVVSDCSEDATDRLLQTLESPRMSWFRLGRRSGKTAALNEAVPRARGEIIVFSDANSIYEREAIQRLVENFADPDVGYVTGRLLYEGHESSVAGTGSDRYMRYENWLREQETRVGSIVGVNGGVDAVRRGLYGAMRPDQLPDFVLPLAVVERGFRVVYDPRAVCREPATESAGDEYRMRVRVSLRALWALKDMRALLNPIRHGVFAWQLWLHKVARYAAFAFLGIAFVANAALAAGRPMYLAFFGVQLFCYLAAGLGWLVERAGGRLGPLFAPYYFVLVNVAAAQAFALFLLGKKRATWTPRKG
jgi:cellulose synthase/poly-beta-1,6-N-acetylglucosamine synthase-like glycosyltransferase